MKRIGECELCGSKKAERKTKIDKVILNACDDCVKFGQEIPKVELIDSKKTPASMEMGEGVLPNFHVLIRNERSKMNMTQEDLAKKLNEKSSVIKRVEDGWEPPMNVIKKFERLFGIKLTQELKEEKVGVKAGGSKLTIGDVVEIN